MMEVTYAIPTYDRPELIQRATLAYLEWSGVSPERVDIWVSGEAQMPLYKILPSRWRARLRVGVKGLMENRNFADAQYAEGTRLLWMNDDIFRVSQAVPSAETRTGKLRKVPVTKVAEEGFAACEEHGANLWGIYANTNRMSMGRGELLVKVGLYYIVGCFYGVIVRSDPSLLIEYGGMKEDYERALKYYERDGKVVRLNYYCPITIYYNSPDMFSEGSKGRVEANVAALEKRWPQWVTRSYRKKSPYPEILIRDRHRD